MQCLHTSLNRMFFRERKGSRMANLSGIVKRIIGYASKNPEKTDYFIVANTNSENKVSFSVLVSTIFSKKTKTVNTSFLDISLYRCGGVVFFRMAGYIKMSLTSTNTKIATLPEGFRPVLQIFKKYSVNQKDGTEIILTIESNGNVSVKGNTNIPEGTGCNFMESYVWAGEFWDYE